MAAIPLPAIETATGTTGSNGVALFTFGADIDTGNHLIAVDRLPQGDTIDYTVTGTRQITFIAPSIPLADAKVWLWNGGVSGVSIGTGQTQWDTVAELVSDAAIELGIAQNALPIADPFASTDPNILQLLSFLKRGGRKLARSRTWTHLTNEYTFSTANGTSTYSLPSDYRGFVPDTAWNRTTRYQMGGQLTPQEWQFLQAITIAGTVYNLFRIQGNQIRITPTPAAVNTVAFEYLTTSWVKPAGQAAPTSDLPVMATDVVCFDPALVVAMLVAVFQARKGFASFEDGWQSSDFQTALAQAASDDSPGRTVYLGGRRGVTRRINRWNLPDTGLVG